MREYILCLLFGFLSISVSAKSISQSNKHNASTVAEFVNKLEVLRLQNRIPGLSFAVIKDQQIVVAGGLGMADVEQQAPATADTLFNIASVTKPISAVVIMALVEQGKLNLDEPLTNYSKWDEFCHAFQQQPSIFAKNLKCEPANHTLRHLLTHTATGSPGSYFSYNPILYSWASRPVMAAMNTSFSTLVAKHVFQPANMSRSARIHRSLALPETLRKLSARPYMIDDNNLVVPSPPLSEQGDGAAGGVISSVLDLAKFDIALEQNELISSSSKKQMMKAFTREDGASLEYGLGWFIQQHNGKKLVWHSGWWENAFSSLYLKIPDEKLTFIILANSEGIWWHNPLDKAQVHNSAFAQAFLNSFALPTSAN
ncbi:serine hydrolase domain-containing protein [Aliiglaciecola lipolytica]|uniref:Beta-lactamase-related domain-containing protein n=1 Tax=Aliiglaciecola lipolytica E3 TaxID=1127673 RepID=K6WYS9_9ALTE|nr:serine hydrolase domain-containing protein [Aliiglaciecola lipolytica]GAC13609.1 hypothetical protein GLIP_0967 [Aliiglaciecola lipolytica E3]